MCVQKIIFIGLLLSLIHPKFLWSEPYRAVATVGMVADVVQAVGGKRVKVRTIVGAGVDPHLYSPTRNDVVALSQADIIFLNGLMLEGKMTQLLARMAQRGKPVYAVAELIANSDDFLLVNNDNQHDPHLWMDVRGWMKAVDVVVDALSRLDSSHRDFYRNNANTYLAFLEALDIYARTTISSIPPNQRVLVTAHDAFQYMGRAYNLEVRGIQGLNTDSEAGLRDIENLVDFIVQRNIPAVFVETSVSDRNVRALVEGAQARGHSVSIGGSLFSDAMGIANTYEGTYIGMMDHNITTIVRALGGEAPKCGMQGKLNEE